MKTFKTLGIFLLLTVMCVGFTSCGDDYKSRLPELLIKDMEFEASKDAITKSQIFRNEDLTNYGVSVDANALWCKSWIDYDTSTLYVEVLGRGESTDEDPYSDRSCKVTLTDVRDNTVRSFNVSQKQLNAVLVNGNEYQVPSAGADIDIEVQYNVDFTVVIPDDVTWVHKKAATRGLQKQTVTLTVDENNDGSARNASVVIKSADESIKKTIKIYQVFNPVYSIDVKEFTVDELSQTVKVNVTANFQFDTYPEEDWITSGGRETVSDTKFIQKLNVSAFKEKKEKRASTVEFYANVKTAEGTYKEIKETVSITQLRTLYIPADSVKLAVGDSTLVEVVNTQKRDLVWSSSDEKVFTVDSKGQVKCVGNDGDGKATITVKSKDGSYSDQIIAEAKKAVDLYKYLVCKWDSIESIIDGVTTKTLTFKITNTSDQTILLTRYEAKKDSADTSIWYGGNLSENLGGKGEKKFELGAVPTTNYYMTLKYTYMKENYTLGFSKSGKMTITKDAAPAVATTRRSAKARRR